MAFQLPEVKKNETGQIIEGVFPFRAASYSLCFPSVPAVELAPKGPAGYKRSS